MHQLHLFCYLLKTRYDVNIQANFLPEIVFTNLKVKNIKSIQLQNK